MVSGVQTRTQRPGRIVTAALAVAWAVVLMTAPHAAASSGQSAAPAWVPSPSDTWQYQLQGAIDLTVHADVFDVDAFDVTKSTVAALHAEGHHVVCYVDAGSWEPYRPDKSRYPKSVIGNAVAGWPGERWLDIRRLDVLGPIIDARIARCERKGFDGVEYDWVDSYAQNTGFDISKADSLRFDTWLAKAAHARGLAVGLKNALGLVRSLVDRFDFAVNEQCFQYQRVHARAALPRHGQGRLQCRVRTPPLSLLRARRSARHLVDSQAPRPQGLAARLLSRKRRFSAARGALFPKRCLQCRCIRRLRAQP